MTAGELIEDNAKIKLSKGVERAILGKKTRIDDFSFLGIVWYCVKRWKVQLLVLWGVGYPLVQLLMFFDVL